MTKQSFFCGPHFDDGKMICQQTPRLWDGREANVMESPAKNKILDVIIKFD